MQHSTLSIFLATAVGVRLQHIVEDSTPTLWVRHVKNQAACDALNEELNAPDLYYFDNQACACFWDEEVLFDVENADQLSAILGQIPSMQVIESGVQSPLDPAQVSLECQVDQIFDHGLDENCEAFAQNLRYDYRTVIDDYLGFNHKHGEPNSPGFDEHGHFGNFDDECPGNVVHWVEKDSDMVTDKPIDFQELIRQALSRFEPEEEMEAQPSPEEEMEAQPSLEEENQDGQTSSNEESQSATSENQSEDAEAQNPEDAEASDVQEVTEDSEGKA